MRARGILRTLGLLFLVIAFPGFNRAPGHARISNFGSAPVSVSKNQQLSADGKALLKAYLEAAKLKDLEYPSFDSYRNGVREFYESSGGSLPWIVDRHPTKQAAAIVKVLELSDREGLNPADYDGPRWAKRVASIDSGRPPEPELIRFDLALTISTMRYVSDLHRGRVNPRTFHFDLDIQNKAFDLSDFLRQKLINADDVEAVMKTVEPPFPAYRRTLVALATYMNLASEDDGETFPVPAKPVKPDKPYDGIPQLTRLLSLLGDLRGPAEEPASPGAPGLVYKGALVTAVKHFQQRHGLQPDGILDAHTFKELNTPLRERVAQLTLTLERWRWLPHEFERPPIVVNIPEFRVYAANEDYNAAFSMKVVVGRSYKHQTPVFATQVKSVIFRPYWNVPLSIQRNELLPELRKNPNYLEKHSYEVVDAREQVVSDNVVSEDMKKQLNTGKLAIRQTPGSDNALGLLKFDMPNAYDVYMHGTPDTQLFSRSRRDFSHGCIRVENPAALAAWLLRDQPEWDTDRILAAMNSDRTLRVSLTKPIPVLILYGTAIVTENGDIHFYDDIYGYDAALEQALAKGYPYSVE